MTIEKLKDQVKYCLSNFPQTRNSDIELTISIWRTFCGVRDTINVSQLKDLPREDGVKRVRAAFNMRGEFLPTDYAVMKQRKMNEVVWRKAMGWPEGDGKLAQSGEQKSLI